MMKKVNCYLESSALWSLFYDERGSALIESCLDNPQINCFSSHWSQLEICRGIKKRENQKEINSNEAQQLQLFIDTDLKRLLKKKKLQLVQITTANISNAKRIIGTYNLYASDALHLATALDHACKIILVDDYHFQRLDTDLLENEGLIVFTVTKSLSELNKTLNL